MGLGDPDHDRRGFDPSPEDRLALSELIRPADNTQALKLADRLLTRFRSLGGVLAADPEALRGVLPDQPAAAAIILAANSAMVRSLRAEVLSGPIIGNQDRLATYLHATMSREPREIFRVLFLDSSKRMIGDEAIGLGSIGESPVFPREVIRRALELAATAVILVHNHPGGDPQPSEQDIRITGRIREACRLMQIDLLDHLVVARTGWVSFRAAGLLA